MARCLIYNPNAGSAEQTEQLRAAVGARGDLRLCVTDASGDAHRLATDAADRGDDLVVAAGGDGTIGEVVNGLMSRGDERAPASSRPQLAILPLGTGNDLPRTLDVPRHDPAAALDLIDAGRFAAIDVLRVRHCGADPSADRYCANVAAGGFSGQMKEVMTDELKARWGPLAYLRGAIKALPDLENYRTRLRFDGGPWEELKVLNVVCANGRYTGGGTPVAPAADPTDGLIDVVVVKWGTAAELARLAAKFTAGSLADKAGAETAAAGESFLDDDRVLFRRARRVEVESDPGMWFNVDGELLTNVPIAFTAVHAALEVIVGPAFGT